MSAVTWLVVANSATARILEYHGTAADPAPVRDFDHPEGRAKGADLATDRPGHAASGHGGSRTAYEPRTDTRRAEQERFARTIAQELAAAHGAGMYSRLILAASSPFLGILHEQLPAGVAGCVERAVDKDWTTATPHELSLHLRR